MINVNKLTPIKIILVFFGVLLGIYGILIFVNGNKHNSLSSGTNQIANGVYSWPEIGLTIKLPENFTASNELAIPGPNNPDLPIGIEIERKPSNGDQPSESLTFSDFMHIEIYKLGGNLDKFIQEVNSKTNKYRGTFYTDRDRKLMENLQVGGTETKWFIATENSPDTIKEYEIYFVNKNYGFILRAQNSWGKKDITQILSGISLN